MGFASNITYRVVAISRKKIALIQINFAQKGCFLSLLSGSKSRQPKFLYSRETVSKFSQ